jgi:hypothetical protein
MLKINQYESHCIKQDETNALWFLPRNLSLRIMFELYFPLSAFEQTLFEVSFPMTFPWVVGLDK